MMINYKNRVLKEGMLIKVYFNLHTHLFSVVALEGEYKGKVVAHGDDILLGDGIKFKISKAGQERTRREKQRNVHAYIVGIFRGNTDQEFKNKGYYNPYKTDDFIDFDTKEVLKEVHEVVCRNKKFTYR